MKGIKLTSTSLQFPQVKKPLCFLKNASMLPEDNDAAEGIQT